MHLVVDHRVLLFIACREGEGGALLHLGRDRSGNIKEDSIAPSSWSDQD